MRVAGVQITPEQIEAVRVCLARLLARRGPVRAINVADACWDDEDAPAGFGLVLETAKSLLQRERKAGRIRHIGGGKWVRVEQEVGDDAD